MHIFFVLIYVLFAVATVLYFYERAHSRRVERECERLTKAYDELMTQSSLRDTAMLTALKSEREVADQLAPIVENYVKIIDETAALLKDDKPPSIETERQSLKRYHEQIARRQEV